MPKPKVFEKPSGVKDILPEAVSRLRNIESRVMDCMERWGYRQIMTPTLEYYDTVGAMSSTSDKKLFKLLDNRGTTLVLRSDMTAPIARVVSSLLKAEQMPIRLAYHANVFRAIEEEAGREAEFFQTGVELVGDDTADADAEVIALAIAALQAAGVKQFKLAMGHQGLLHGLLETALNGREDELELLKDRLLARDYVGYRRQISEMKLPTDVQTKLEAILELRGGKEVCERVSQLTTDAVTREAIQRLCDIWEALEAYGVADRMMIDLTMIGNFSYYTGMIFEAYSAELGFPVASGGRYDNLLQQFGRPAAATGFALKTTRILDILGPEESPAMKRIMILYDAQHRQAAFARAAELRESGSYAVVTRQADQVPATLLQQSGDQVERHPSIYEGQVFDELIIMSDAVEGGTA